MPIADHSAEYARVLDVAISAAREAGAALVAFQSCKNVREKGKADLVTDADVAAQQAIVTAIQASFPDHGLLGEESLQSDGDSNWRWIIDPLDGTANYVHGFPFYAVSIGVEHAGELVVGVVYDPTRDEMYSAAKGAGAWRNGTRLSVSHVSRVDQALISASLPVARGMDHPAVRQFFHVLPAAQSLQRTGSAAMNLACVAAGTMDAFWSGTLKPWDMAGGVVLVREAGGTVTAMDGGTFQVDQPSLIAATQPVLVDELSQLLSSSEI